ncbi:hypothetical protein Tco_0777626 [Tanacetum coccineum]
MEEINNFQQEPDENLYRAWEQFKELLMKCPQYYLTEMREVILFYNGLGIPTRQKLDSRGAIPSKTTADAKVAIQEMTEYSQKWHNGTSGSRSTETSDGLATIQAQMNNLGREIKKVNEKVYAAQGLFELRRNQGDDLMPTIEEGEVIEEFRTSDDELNTGIDDYPSYCDYDKKIHIDCARNLKFSCMIGFEFTHASFFPLLYVNVMSKKFHNSIMKEKMVYKGNNVVGALMNVPIFVGNFSVVTDFAVLENMDDYHNEGMGDVIFAELFLREVGIKTKRFKGMITIYNGNDEVSEEDKMNGILHSYQKLKGFYKEVLNIGPDYIRDAKMEEWLTHWQISVHETE